MVLRLSRFFHYLGCHFIRWHRLPTLNEVGLLCFRDLVYQEVKNNVRDAVITLIDREREGEQIDRALLKNVLGIFVEIGMGNMEAYENDFESAMLDDTASYYSRKAASWILEDSCPDYMIKEFLREVINLCGKSLRYVNECFMNRLLFHEALKEAFGVFYNKEVAGRTTAELLATFFDNILKKGDTLEEVVKLLPYVSDQDLFAEFYRKKLARRLLFDKSANDEHERSILTKLKQKCEGQFTSKMEGMASALLLFNSSERLRYFEIKSQLNLTDEDVVRLLHSLACAKYKILTKEPNTKTVAQTDYFEFNPKFTNKMRRIEIPLPAVDEKKKVIEDVDRDRRYAIDASIIRIMKRRKVLSHHQLVMECVEQPGEMFKHSSKEITKGIEHLIAREFLERDKHNPNVLKYLP